MPTDTSITAEMRQAKIKSSLWNVARNTIGVLLSVTGFTASIGAIIGVATAAYAADGGHPNGGYAFMLMGMALSAVMGLLPPVIWVFSGSDHNRSNSYISLGLAGLCLVGCALGHNFGGSSWSDKGLDWVVGGAAILTIALTMLAWVIVARAEAASERHWTLVREQQNKNRSQNQNRNQNPDLPPPPRRSPYERTIFF